MINTKKIISNCINVKNRATYKVIQYKEGGSKRTSKKGFRSPQSAEKYLSKKGDWMGGQVIME